ncbi:hypothetical protein LXL04_006073 [Taraxacum kok-saghyz]
MQTGRGFPATRGDPNRMERGFPVLAGNGSGMERRQTTIFMEDPTENLINENEEQTQQPTRDAEVLQQQDAGTGAQANGTTDAQVDGINNTETFEATDAQADGTNRRLTSVVWNHFKKAKIEGVDKAICNYCGKKLSGKSKNGTTHLRDHYNICMARKNKDIRQTILNPRQEKKDGPVSLGTHTFDQNVSMSELAKMIVLHEYPINMVEHIGFRNFVNSVNPLFKHVSRTTIKSDIKRIYDIQKTKIKKIMSANQGRVAVTTDMWTASNQKRGYMVVTAHYIDDSWNLCNKILRFMYVPAPHNAKTLTKALMECLVAWSIDCKLSTLTLDNCSVNIAMMEKMKDKLKSDKLLLNGELLHMKCCAHILNLIVQQGLGAIQSRVESIRDSVVYWTATPKRVETFENAKDGLSLSSKRKLVLDCKTRWNSTYLMLMSAIVYKDVFNRLVHIDKNYKQPPTNQDWHLANVMCEKLKLFYSVTEMFSGVKYPTANIFFPKICEIRLLLKECLISPYVEIKEMATNMISKFDQYWSLIHGILAIATILDPRFKMKLIEYYFPQIYGHESPKEIDRIRKLTYDLVK